MSAHPEAIDAEHTALAVRQDAGALAMPVVSPEQAREAMKAYYDVCEAVLTPDDYQTIEQWDPVQRRKMPKKFKKKSAVKKLQTFWDISVEIKSTHKDDLPDDNYGVTVIAVAINRNGRRVEAVGGCSTTEERFDVQRKDREKPEDFEYRRRKANARAYHDIASTAETRATNRAAMNCLGVGGGEVTAEEMQKTRASAPEEAPPSLTPEEIAAKAKERREKLNARIHILQKERGVSDELYREMLCEMFPDVFSDASVAVSSTALDYQQCLAFGRELDARTKGATP